MATRRSSRLSNSSIPDTSPPVPAISKSIKRKVETDTEDVPKPTANRKRKASATAIDSDGFAIPSTPKRSRAKTATEKNEDSPLPPPTASPLPPFTPTPSLATAMAIPYSSGDIDDSTPPPPSNRLANPLSTNAPLFSPMTNRLLSRDPASNPENGTAAKEELESTTDHILEEALKHLLKVDPRLKAVIEKHRCRVFSAEGLAEVIDPWRSLASGIISQQVSGAAAKAIKNRFISLFNPTASSPSNPPPQTFPSPTTVSTTPIETLRTAGLSQRKAEYIQGLASKFSSGELTTEFLMSASYEEVLTELTKVRGLGKWSVEMFACFGLKRLDVFSTGDLGVQRGMAALEGRDVSKLKAKGGGKWKYMSEKEMLEISERFAPYRSVFMWYMWRIEDTDVSSLEV